MNYYNRYPGDYSKDTQDLSLAEHGAFTLLLDHLYGTERVLPKNPVGLFRVCRAFTQEEQQAVLSVVQRFFIETEDGYTNKRFEEERKRAKARIDAARENGAKGGRKQTQAQQEPAENPAGSRQDTQDEPNGSAPHQPSAISQRPKAEGQKVEMQSRGARLPIDWKADEELLEFCRTTRPDLNCFTVEATFRDYWIAQPGQKGVKKDWSATWRNWVRNEKQVFPPRGQVKTQPGTSALFEQNMRNAQLAKELIFGKQTEVIDHE